MDGLEDARQALQFAKNAPTAEMRTAYAAQGILMLLISNVEQPVEPGEQWQPPEDRRLGQEPVEPVEAVVSGRIRELERQLADALIERDEARESASWLEYRNTNEVEIIRAQREELYRLKHRADA